MSPLEKQLREEIQEILDEPLPEPDPTVIVEQPLYNFPWIAQSLGLIPLGKSAAINPAAIVDIEHTPEGFIIGLHGDREYTLDDENMAEFEAILRQRLEDQRLRQKEVVREQLRAQLEAAAEIQQGVQPGAILPPSGKRWRQ